MCLDLWSTADDSVRISAFLAVRKLASSPDEGILDMILKVRTSKGLNGTTSSDSRTEYIPSTRAVFKGYECTYAPLHQPHEKLRVGDLLSQPRSCVPTRLRLYSPACHPLTNEHEDEN